MFNTPINGNIKHLNENFDKCDSDKRQVLSEYNSTNNEKNFSKERNNFRKRLDIF